jgi:tetrahydromethanopterin S-methyltransferase subunit D
MLGDFTAVCIHITKTIGSVHIEVNVKMVPVTNLKANVASSSYIE